MGLVKERLPGTFESYLQLVHPDDRESVRERLQEAIRGDRLHFLEEHRLSSEEVGVRWVEGRGRIQRDDSGRAVLVKGTVVDVTPRKEAEQALRESEERFRRLAAASLKALP